MRRSRVMLFLPLAAGCSVTGYEPAFRVPNERVRELIERAPYPADLGPREAVASVADLRTLDSAPAMKLTLPECVDLALRNNREYLRGIENALLARIDEALARHDYWPAMAPLTLSAQMAETSDAPADSAAAGTALRIAKLPIGGSLGLTAGWTGALSGGSAGPYTLTPALSLTVPFLRGGGRIVAMEPQVQSARAAVYARRELEDLRQRFLIVVVGRYFAVLQQQRAIVNFERNLESAERLLRQSEAFERLGRVSRTDVLRAQLQATTAENALRNAREAMSLLLDTLKLDLALDPAVELTLSPQEIEFRREPFDERDHAEAALARNLPWQNACDRYEDARRELEIAYNTSRSRVDLTAGRTLPRVSTGPLGTYGRAPASYSLGLGIEIPLDPAPRNREYQAAVQKFLQQERAFMLVRDDLVRRSRETVINVRRGEFTVELQERAIQQAERGLRLILFEYERGRVTNRDVIQAQNDLLAAQNGHLEALVQHRIAVLEAKQFSGALEIDPEGQWLR